MFTGLVQHLGTVAAATRTPAGMRLSVDASGWLRDAQAGESIAVNGCCLTLVTDQGGRLAFDMVPQTLERTTMAPGDSCAAHLEWRALAKLPAGSYDVAVRFDRDLPADFHPPRWCAKPLRKLRQMAWPGQR